MDLWDLERSKLRGGKALIAFSEPIATPWWERQALTTLGARKSTNQFLPQPALINPKRHNPNLLFFHENIYQKLHCKLIYLASISSGGSVFVLVALSMWRFCSFQLKLWRFHFKEKRFEVTIFIWTIFKHFSYSEKCINPLNNVTIYFLCHFNLINLCIKLNSFITQKIMSTCNMQGFSGDSFRLNR